MTKIILTILIPLLVVALSYAAQPTPAQELERYIRNWTAMAPNCTATALSYIPAVLLAAEKYKIDHMLIAIIISGESSWKIKSVGKRGEIGLMQVLGQCAADDCELKTAAGQIDCGVKCLRKSIDVCNQGFDLTEGLNLYMTGHCRPVHKVTLRRMRLWKLATMEAQK